MTHGVDEVEPARPVAPVASPAERLDYIADLTGVLRQLAVDGGFNRLATLLELARCECEVLKGQCWRGTVKGKAGSNVPR